MSSDYPYAPPESNIAVNDPTELAGRGVRLGGALIDSIVTMLIIFPIVFASGYWEKAMAGELTAIDTLWAGLLGLAVFFVLHGYLLAKHGQTIGKRMLKIRIVSIHDDQILPLWKVIGYRYVPLMAAGQFPLFGQFVGLFDSLFIFRSNRRCIHDLIAGTKVVTAEAP